MDTEMLDDRAYMAVFAAKESLMANGWDEKPKNREWVDPNFALVAMTEWEDLATEFGGDVAQEAMACVGSFVTRVKKLPDGFDTDMDLPGYLVCRVVDGLGFESFKTRGAAEWFLRQDVSKGKPVARSLATHAHYMDAQVAAIEAAGLDLDSLGATAGAPLLEIRPEQSETLLRVFGLGTNSISSIPHSFELLDGTHVISHDSSLPDFCQRWQVIHIDSGVARSGKFHSRRCAEAFDDGVSLVSCRLIDNFLFDPTTPLSPYATEVDGILCLRDVAIKPTARIAVVCLEEPSEANAQAKQAIVTQWEKLADIVEMAKLLMSRPGWNEVDCRELWTVASLWAMRMGNGIIVDGSDLERTMDVIARTEGWIVADCNEAINLVVHGFHQINPSLEETRETVERTSDMKSGAIEARGHEKER